MDSRRLFRLITRRWWLITIVAVAGAAAGFLFTERQNDSIEDTYEATAPVLILQTLSESDDAYETRLRSLESGARLALANQITGSDTFSVGANVGLGRLEFAARASTSDRAVELAEELRDLYEAAEPAADTIGQLQERLTSLGLEIQQLRAERARLTAGSPIDPGVAAELALMEAQLSSLRQQVAALNLGVLVPGLGTAVDELGLPRPVEDVQAELIDLRIVLRQLEDEYEELRAEHPTALPAEEENLDLLVLDQKIRDLESIYVSSSLTIEELLNGGGTSLFQTDTAVADVTPLPSSAMRMGVLGLLLGGALAMGTIIGADRMRRPVLGLEDDLSLQMLATVDPVRPGAFEDRAWYPSADDVRRSDVQGLRAALESVTSRGTASIALAGLGTSDSAVQELAADLATSIAAADRKVLLVDAIFSNPSGLPEYSSSGPTLADIVTRRETSADAWEELKKILDERDEVLPELLALPAGHLDGDPVDAVAGRRFRELLEVAKEFVEVVIVAAPKWGDSATDVLTQRLENFVLVGRLGATPAGDIDDAASELATRGASALGLVLLRRRSQLRGTIREQQVRRGRARSEIESAPAATVPPSSPDDPAGYVEPPPLRADPFDGSASMFTDEAAADELLVGTDLPEEIKDSTEAPSTDDRSTEREDDAPARDNMVSAAPASAPHIAEPAIEEPADSDAAIFSAGLAGSTTSPSVMPTFDAERPDVELEADPIPSFEPPHKEPEILAEKAATSDVAETPWQPIDSLGDSARATAAEGAIRPEIVSPTPSSTTGSNRPVDHINEIHIADEADVVDTVATPRDLGPAQEDVSVTSAQETATDDIADPGGESPYESVWTPKPVETPEPVETTEPAATDLMSETVLAPEPAASSEPVAPEPVAPEPAEPEPAAPEPTVTSESVLTPEPVATPEILPEPEPEPEADPAAPAMPAAAELDPEPPQPGPEPTLRDRVAEVKAARSMVVPEESEAVASQIGGVAGSADSAAAIGKPEPTVDSRASRGEPADTDEVASRERRPSWTKWPQRFRRGGQSRSTNGGERRDRRWTAPLETGEIYLIEQLSELLRHGIDRPQFYGHPAGALLMYRSQLTESAAAMLYNAVFKDAPDRSEELEDSIARVISVEPVYSEKEATVDKIGWWYEALGLESDSSRQEELIGALDTWLRQRLMTALELLRLGDFAWYLASPSRTFEVIVDGDSFNTAQVRALRAGAVARYLERLRIGLWRDGRDEPDAAAVVQDALADVEAFDAKLEQLSRTNQTEPFTRQQLDSVGVLLRDAYGRS